MTTLWPVKDDALAVSAGVARTALRDWLQGHWALLFSDPDDFAPPASTPPSFMGCVAEELRRARIKPMAVIDRPERLRANGWLQQASSGASHIVLEQAMSGGVVIDLATHALVQTLLRLVPPYVLVLDDYGRIRSTIKYRARRIDRPRTLQELLCMLTALRGDDRNARSALASGPS